MIKSCFKALISPFDAAWDINELKDMKEENVIREGREDTTGNEVPRSLSSTPGPLSVM